MIIIVQICEINRPTNADTFCCKQIPTNFCPVMHNLSMFKHAQGSEEYRRGMKGRSKYGISCARGTISLLILLISSCSANCIVMIMSTKSVEVRSHNIPKCSGVSLDEKQESEIYCQDHADSYMEQTCRILSSSCLSNSI
jgi:hypothetical protein